MYFYAVRIAVILLYLTADVVIFVLKSKERSYQDRFLPAAHIQNKTSLAV